MMIKTRWTCFSRRWPGWLSWWVASQRVYHCFDHTARQRLHTIDEPYEADPGWRPDFDAVASQHPMCVASLSGRVGPGTTAALSDFADLPTLRCLPLYIDFYVPHGINDQLLYIVRQDRQHIASLTFQRDRVGSPSVSGPSST